MIGTALTHRLATRDDLPALSALMDAAIAELQKPFLDEAQIASSRTIMGLDTQLVDDGTYFVVEQAACRLRRLEPARDALWRRARPARRRLLDPARTRARARHVHASGLRRRGVGRLILSLCEDAAAPRAFRVELMATMSASRSTAPAATSRSSAVDDRGGAPVPLVRITPEPDLKLIERAPTRKS